MSWKRPYNARTIEKSLSWVRSQPYNAGILMDAVSMSTEEEVSKAALKRIDDAFLMQKVFYDGRNTPERKLWTLIAQVGHVQDQGSGKAGAVLRIVRHPQL